MKAEILNFRSSDSAVEGDLDVGDWASSVSPFEVDKDVRLVSSLGMNRLQGLERGLIER